MFLRSGLFNICKEEAMSKKENREPIIRRAFLTTKLKDDDPYRKKGYKYFLDEYICSGSNIIHSYKPKYFKTKKEVEEYKRSRR